jgi:hypothetical protein
MDAIAKIPDEILSYIFDSLVDEEEESENVAKFASKPVIRSVLHGPQLVAR